MVTFAKVKQQNQISCTALGHFIAEVPAYGCYKLPNFWTQLPDQVIHFNKLVC